MREKQAKISKIDPHDSLSCHIFACFGMKKGSYQKVVVIWLVELIKIHILTNYQGLRLINEKETSENVENWPSRQPFLSYIRSYQKVAVIWLVKLIKIHILTNFQGLLLINERETSENLREWTHCAAFSVTYWQVLAWKWGRIKKLNKS